MNPCFQEDFLCLKNFNEMERDFNCSINTPLLVDDHYKLILSTNYEFCK